MEKIDRGREVSEMLNCCKAMIDQRIGDIPALLDKLAIRVARLEVYYKAHRKEHRKNET